MIFTTRMVYLTAVSLQEHADAIAGEFLRLGLMHFVDIATVDHSLGERIPTPNGSLIPIEMLSTPRVAQHQN